MILPRLTRFGLAGLLSACAGAEEIMDRVEQALTFRTSDDRLRAHLSGLVDLEGYHIQGPAPGLIFSEKSNLFNSRFTLFLDAQAGSQLYLFVQSRFDQGFDPGASRFEVRLDEYALRYTPWEDGRLNIQIGKFATVVGTWSQRHLSWQNPFVTAPLPYENLTSIYDTEAPESAGEFTAGIVEERYDYNPVIWGANYASGLAVSGLVGRFDYAFEVKNAALSSRPESWDVTSIDFAHPTVNGRIGFRPNTLWRLGFSASTGPYYRPEALSTFPLWKGIGNYRENLIGQDISFGWGQWQFWAEFYEARFEVPNVGNADTFVYYLETKYKFTPQFYGALRWNQQIFGNVPDGAGGMTEWGNDVWRIDAALGYRFTAHTQLKFQYSLERGKADGPTLRNNFATQFTLRF